MRLGGAAKSAGDNRKAAEAFGRVLYDFPLSSAAPLAQTEYAGLPNVQPLTVGSQRYKLELGRAERLFGARRYPEARKAFETLRPIAAGDDREVVDLRLAECDYYQKRFQVARDAIKPYTTKGSRKGEALFFYALAVGDLGDRAEFLTTVRRIVDEFPTESWAEEALNNQATRHIVDDQDDEADAVFRELYEKYPGGSYAERAAWKAGWRAYRQERPADTVRFFERAAVDFPRSDYRPAWLYWAGRAHDRLKEPALAEERYMLAAADYMNWYYGRLALRRLDGRTPAPRVLGEPTSLLPPPANEPVVRALLSVDRYDEALNELRYAQRAWGDSPAIQATIAYVHRKKGLTESNTTERFNLLRGSITLMRRAYPQFMAAGGQDLPRDILVHHLPDRILGSHPQVFRAEQPRSVPDCRVDGPGVDVRARHPVACERVRAAAAVAPHGPPAGAQDEDPVFDTLADRSRGQRADGNGVLRRPGPRIRRHPLRARELQRRRNRGAALDQRTSRADGSRGVHRRYPVSRDAELREADSRHGRGLPAVVRLIVIWK